MPSPDNFGFDAARLLAGFSGGVVHALVSRQRDPYTVAASIVAGTMTANYLSLAAVEYTGKWIGEGGTAFILGLTAMIVCQGIVSAARAWKPTSKNPPEAAE
jgi:hypothetical protein